MTTYRNDLETAHQRIAQLEALLREKTPEPQPKVDPIEAEEKKIEAAIAATKEEIVRVRLWHFWPLPVLVAAVVTYAVRFGVSLPTWSLTELVPLERGSMLCAVVSTLLMTFGVWLRVESGGASTVGQRVLTIVAALLSAPLLILGALALLQLGSIVLAIGGVGAALIGAGYWLVGFIRTGET